MCPSPESSQGPVDEPLLNSPAGPPRRMMSVHWALLHLSFWVPRKELPNWAPPKRDAPFPGPSKYLLKFPVNEIPRFSNGPLRREAPVSGALFYTFPSKSPVNEPPLHVPQEGPYGERSFISRANSLFLHLYLSESPLMSPPTKTGKKVGHRPRSSTWTEGLHTTGCGLIPHVDRLRHCSLYPSAMQPSARYIPPRLE